MKKGISLIVLVITVIVLAILAGAVIVSLSGGNDGILTQATNAVNKADLANAKNVVVLEYAQGIARGQAANKLDGYSYYLDGSTLKVMTMEKYGEALTAAGFKGNVTDVIESVDSTSGAPTLKNASTTTN